MTIVSLDDPDIALDIFQNLKDLDGSSTLKAAPVPFTPEPEPGKGLEPNDALVRQISTASKISRRISTPEPESNDSFVRQISTASQISRRISSSSFKRCITGDELLRQSSSEPGDISDGPVIRQVSPSTSSGNSAVPTILEPLGPTRKEDLIVFLPEELENLYQPQSIIGQGGFGVVRKGICKLTKKPVAIKSIKMGDLKFTSAYDRECIVAWMCNHPYLVRLLDCFSDDKDLHLVMDYLSGRTVQAIVQARTKSGRPGGLSADQQERFIWAMLSGISYLHHHKIAHRDCKSENFMQKSESATAPLIMMDFGLAVRCERDTLLTEKVGTPEYAAPEVIRGSYNQKCDIWSIGVVSYIICVGSLPFIGKTAVQVMKKIRDTEAKFDPEKWDLVKPELKETVQDMLVKDPNVRPTTKKLCDQNHCFFDSIKASSDGHEDAQHAQKCCNIS